MFQFSILFLLVTSIFSQELVDEYIQKVMLGIISEAIEKLPEYKSKYPNHPGVIYLDALLEVDGDLAKEKFTQIYNMHKGSQYSENSIIKVSEYYYTSGLYLQSAEWLKKIPKYYSKSQHLEKSIKLFINSLVVSDHLDSAVYYSRVFKKQFPNINLEEYMLEVKQDYETEPQKTTEAKLEEDISNEIKKLEAAPKKNKNIIVKIQDLLDKVKEDITTPINEYSLQIGAFGKRSNAEEQRDILLKSGYDARIDNINSNGVLLYIVRVGYFINREDAKRQQDSIQSRLAMNSIIIKSD